MDVFLWRVKIDRTVLQLLSEIAKDNGTALPQKFAISRYGQDAIDVLDRVMTPEKPTDGNLQLSIDELANEMRPSLEVADGQMGRAREIVKQLLERHRFSTNSQHERSVDHSLMDRVLKARKGTPLALCVRFSAIARRCGVDVGTVLYAGHVFSRVTDTSAVPARYSYIDISIGGIEHTAAYLRDSYVGLTVWSDDFLRPSEPPDVLTSMCSTLSSRL
ncbi:hypothetical protein HDU93_009064 [Gonapodya sp. JEL0774]|nr:hypothetical protein HDU93_009064 [Gonapodya sp. JEL0774]